MPEPCLVPTPSECLCVPRLETRSSLWPCIFQAHPGTAGALEKVEAEAGSWLMPPVSLSSAKRGPETLPQNRLALQPWDGAVASDPVFGC